MLDFFQWRQLGFSDFQMGCVVTIILLILLFFLVELLRFFFFRHPKRASGVHIDGEHGFLFIASSAIADLVKKRKVEFITITKVFLIDQKDDYSLELHIEFDIGADDLPAKIATMQNEILEDLKNAFGITCVKNINVRLKRASHRNKRDSWS